MFTCVLGRWVASTVLPVPTLQALVYDILPSTSAVFSYAIGSILFVFGFICAGVNFVDGYKSNDTPCFI